MFALLPVVTSANAITSKKRPTGLTFICLFLWRVSQVVERTLDLWGGGRDSPEGRLAEKCQPAPGRGEERSGGVGGGDSDGAGWGGDSFSQA